MQSRLPLPARFQDTYSQNNYFQPFSNHTETDAELDEITPGLRSRPDVLEVRWQIYAQAKKWEACVEIAEAIIRLAPNKPLGWIHRSFALHEMKRTQEAPRHKGLRCAGIPTSGKSIISDGLNMFAACA